MKNTTKVVCKCSHAQQDKMYGPQVRVANLMRPKDKTYSEVRCTVCGTVHRVTPLN